MKTSLAVSVALIVALTASAQERGVAPGAAEKFEVATVKQNKSGQNGPAFAGRPGRFSVESATLQELIVYAYELQPFEIFGAPGWATSDRFDIGATMEPLPAGSSDQGPRQRRLLRALLAERFKLVAHEERREMPVYELLVARPDRKLGARMRPFEGECVTNLAALKSLPSMPAQLPAQLPPPSKEPSACILGVGVGRLSARGTPVSSLARSLATFAAIRRRVVDRTALTGQFDFDLEWSPLVTPTGVATPVPSNDALPNVFTALQEQLGLKLESTKESMPVLVIDSVSQPSEN